MKTITMKKFKTDKGEDLDYANLMKSALNGLTKEVQQRGGFSPSEMSERIRILDALKAIKNDELVLEDSDYNVLAGVVKAQRFGIIDQGLVDYAEDVANAKDIEKKKEDEKPENLPN